MKEDFGDAVIADVHADAGMRAKISSCISLLNPSMDSTSGAEHRAFKFFPRPYTDTIDIDRYFIPK